MPAILPDADSVSAWLDPDIHGFDALKVLQPALEKCQVKWIVGLAFLPKDNVTSYFLGDLVSGVKRSWQRQEQRRQPMCQG